MAKLISRPYVLSVIAISLLGAARIAIAADECKDILAHGIYDYDQSRVDYKNTQSFMTWYCSMHNQSSGSNQSLSGTFEGLIEEVPSKIGLAASANSYKNELAQVCSTFRSDTDLQMKVQNALKTVNKSIVEAWQNCLNSAGTTVWVQQTQEPNRFVIHAKYKPVKPTEPFAKVTKFQSGDEKYSRCRKPFPTKLSGTTETINCWRTDAAHAFQWNVGTDAVFTHEGNGFLEIGPAADVNPKDWIDLENGKDTWGWATGEINKKCGSNSVDGIQLNSAPYDDGSARNNGFSFTVRCHVQKKPGLQYAVAMETREGSETAAEAKLRLCKKMKTRVQIAPQFYISSVEGGGSAWWYVYQLSPPAMLANSDRECARR